MSSLSNIATSAYRASTSPLRTHQQVVHFSFHKNLTKYYNRVARQFAAATGRRRDHFNSHVDQFMARQSQLDMASVNNHFVDVGDLSRTPRASLFLRDPRDLIVSGYFYHKRGAEKWCHVHGPKPQDWKIVNGTLPDQLRADETYTECLNRLSLEDGLKAEIQFRKRHFIAMLQWVADPRPLVMKYEDILGNERAAFEKLARHYGFNAAERLLWQQLATGTSALKGFSKHVRNPNSGQWREVFPPEVIRAFEDAHGNLLSATDYS